MEGDRDGTDGVLIWNWALTPATRTARATRGAENDFMAESGRGDERACWERDEGDGARGCVPTTAEAI